MSAIRIETQLEGETLYLPQLKPLLGVVTPATSDWADVQAAVRDLQDYDFDAWREARAAELTPAGQAS